MLDPWGLFRHSVFTMSKTFLNIAFYRFCDLPIVPEVGVEAQLQLRKRIVTSAAALEVVGSVILSPEGLNAFMAGQPEKVKEFIQTMCNELKIENSFDIKESWSDRLPFSRFIVKFKAEIITMGRPDIRPDKFTGARLEPEVLKQWLDEKKEIVLLDTRNRYEVVKGTFRGAVELPIKTFQEFPNALEERKQQWGDKPVVMFCTGGIRCEKATALALEHGLKNVYQLEGGILRYFEKVGGAHYRGDCFVFDGRNDVDPSLLARPDRSLEAFRKSAKLGDGAYSWEWEGARRLLSLLNVSVAPQRIDFPTEPGVGINLFERGRLHEGVRLSHLADYLDRELPGLGILPEEARHRLRAYHWIELLSHQPVEMVFRRVNNALRNRKSLLVKPIAWLDQWAEARLKEHPQAAHRTWDFGKTRSV